MSYLKTRRSLLMDILNRELHSDEEKKEASVSSELNKKTAKKKKEKEVSVDFIFLRAMELGIDPGTMSFDELRKVIFKEQLP